MLAFGCGRKEAAAPKPTGPVPLAGMKSFGNEIYSLANGDAYLINQFDHQLFYLSQRVAVRVPGVDLGGLDPTIYPLANGAAYLVSSDRSKLRLYYLIADRAIEVRETAQSPSAQMLNEPSREGFLWAQAQAANIRHRRYKRNVEDRQPAEEPERDDYR